MLPATANEGAAASTDEESVANVQGLPDYASAANAWQVVEGAYEGNLPGNKTVSGDGTVRVQKNVLPTGTENEFLVYLSVDTQQSYADYFQNAEYQATTSNNYHDDDLGSLVSSMTGNENVQVSGTASYSSHASFTIEGSGGVVLAENVTLYWDQANNVTFFLKVSDSAYVLIGVQVKKNGLNTVRLSSEAEQAIRQAVSQAASLNKVTDVMGDYIEYLEPVAGDYTSAPTYDATTRTLTWIPAAQAGTVQTEQNGNVTTEWNVNAAELVYKVRLATEKKGFASGNSYAVNQSAVLHYGTNGATVTFPVPKVKGLLYNVQLKKVDVQGAPLGGAEFELSGADGSVTSAASATSDAQTGLVKFTGLVGAGPSATQFKGAFTVTETKAPAGYNLLPEPMQVNIGNYTQNPHAFTQDSDGNMLYIAADVEAGEGGSAGEGEGAGSSGATGTTGTTDETDNEGSGGTAGATGTNGTTGSSSGSNSGGSGAITVVNTSGYRLPDTGGPGVLLVTAGGLLILAACLLYTGHKQAKRKE